MKVAIVSKYMSVIQSCIFVFLSIICFIFIFIYFMDDLLVISVQMLLVYNFAKTFKKIQIYNFIIFYITYHATVPWFRCKYICCNWRWLEKLEFNPQIILLSNYLNYTCQKFAIYIIIYFWNSSIQILELLLYVVLLV